MGNQPAGRPYIVPPWWKFCPACMGITKHRHHSTKDRWYCMEKTHTHRARIVNMLKHKTLANPMHPEYTERSES